MFLYIYTYVKSVYTKRKLTKTVMINLFLCKNGGENGVLCAPSRCLVLKNMILNCIIYSKTFGSIICVINAGCLARGQILTSWCILNGSPSSREMYFYKSAKFVSFKVLQVLMVYLPGSF